MNIPWRRKWQPTPASLPGKFYGQRGAWQTAVHRVTNNWIWCVHARVHARAHTHTHTHLLFSSTWGTGPQKSDSSLWRRSDHIKRSQVGVQPTALADILANSRHQPADMWTPDVWMSDPPDHFCPHPLSLPAEAQTSWNRDKPHLKEYRERNFNIKVSPDIKSSEASNCSDSQFFS